MLRPTQFPAPGPYSSCLTARSAGRWVPDAGMWSGAYPFARTNSAVSSIRQFLLLLDQLLAILLELTGHPLDQLIRPVGPPDPAPLRPDSRSPADCSGFQSVAGFRAIGKWQSSIGLVCQARMCSLVKKGTGSSSDGLFCK